MKKTCFLFAFTLLFLQCREDRSAGQVSPKKEALTDSGAAPPASPSTALSPEEVPVSRPELALPANPSAKRLLATGTFVFGRYGCKCIGDRCFTGFKLKGEVLQRGKGNLCGKKRLLFETASLGQAELQLARNLFAALPAQLLDSPEDQYGCPVCNDGSAYFLELKAGGKVRSWKIDSKESELPPDIAAYMKMIRQTLEVLK